MAQDISDPLDALTRLIDAVARQRLPLEHEDLYAVSRLRAGLDEQVRAGLNALDESGRFALLGELQEAMADGGGLEFTAVFTVCLQDDDLPVRGLAAAGLAGCETPEATAALLGSARSSQEDDTVRAEAVAALGEVALRVELGWAGAEEAGEVVGALREIAEDLREEPPLRAAAIAAAAVAHEDWVPALIDDAYGSEDPALRLGAVQAMGRNADPIWLPSLEASLFADEADERSAAAAAMGELGLEDGAPPLLDLLDEDLADLDVMITAVRALGAIGGEEAMGRLAELRTHPDEQLRDAAHEAIEEAALLEGDGDAGFDAALLGAVDGETDQSLLPNREWC